MATEVWLRIDRSSREQGREGTSVMDGHGLGQITAHTEQMVERVRDHGYLGPQDCVGDGF